MNDAETVAAGLDHIKIFPLPTAVLLPGAALPLHIFEPRYRHMIADALAGDRVLAVAMLEAGWEGDYHGRPALRRICGAGRIADHEKLSDGRYNIRVVGVSRIEVIDELPPIRPYREARARIAEERTSPLDLGTTLRHAVLGLCSTLNGEAASSLARAAAGAKTPGQLADACAAALATDAMFRQKILEALDPEVRAKLALELVGEALLRDRPEGKTGASLSN